jgi:hypothetical protein
MVAGPALTRRTTAVKKATSPAFQAPSTPAG